MATAKPGFKDAKRDGSNGFIALPRVVVQSPAFRGASVWARALLIDIAEQFKGHNNGSLLCSRAYMLPLGWKSNDMLVKSRDELIAANLIHRTVMGARPNKASWFALTWYALDPNDKYDFDLSATFVRGAYRQHAKTHVLDRPTVLRRVA